MAAAARPWEGPFSNSWDWGCSKQHTGQLAAGLTALSGRLRKRLGCSGLFKTTSDICLFRRP